jgi:hypothetical protein
MGSEEKELRRLERERNGRRPLQLTATAAEQDEQIAPDPLLRLAVVPELPLLRMKAAVVIRSQEVMDVFVMDHRLNEKRRDVRRVQERMNADLGGVVIVGSETDGAAPFARDLLTPANREGRMIGEVGVMNLAGERLKVMVRVFWDRERNPHRCGYCSR